MAKHRKNRPNRKPRRADLHAGRTYHTDACYEPAAEKTPLCGLEEHTHTEDCYSADGTLVCALPEHMHTDACYEAASTQRFSYADAQLQLTLTVESAAAAGGHGA